MGKTGLAGFYFAHVKVAHIYLNHLDQVDEQLSREPHKLPKIEINKKDILFDYNFEDFKLVDYNSHPFISAPIAI